ncbi:MAG TPA: hypothetical protein VM802_09610 [Chitinophaga sp.]|uniref:methyltransferase family protein n=1 Tax=Chitinophaga sp. TaxID=1869181 RepID=UPI002B5C8B9F|nr:hypothetical protein [Chitinophaga sp.]HVI45118.1 hypothetical protein [Chitinophaga sp.]
MLVLQADCYYINPNQHHIIYPVKYSAYEEGTLSRYRSQLLFFFLCTFLCLIGFVSGLYVPKDINSGAFNSWIPAILTDLTLIVLFGIQHSIMARSWYKDLIKKWVPAPLERSVYVCCASLVLFLMMYLWQPVPYAIFDFRTSLAGSILRITGLAGWLLVLVSTFLINHFDLFGLRQPYLYFTDKFPHELKFRLPFIYKIIRHPIYLGFITACWFTPLMTTGHLLFAAGMTVYILIGIHFEERDLLKEFPEYQAYRKRTGKLFPKL